jgi:3-oxoacyl-[acyl-carrier protein] reductase
LNSISLDEIDILVNNAGVNDLCSIENLALDELMNIFQINCNSAFLLSQALLKSFQKKQYGRIINIGSIWTERAFPLRGSYSMAKSALFAMTKMIAVENAPHNILCNMISPGFIETELTLKNNTPEQLNQFLQKVPLKKMGKPSDVASLAYYLTVENNFITGQNIFIDGGYTCSA